MYLNNYTFQDKLHVAFKEEGENEGFNCSI